MQNDKWGYIKQDGCFLFEPQFDEVSYFRDGFAKVVLNDKYGYIKPDGSFLFGLQDESRAKEEFHYKWINTIGPI